MNTFIQYLNNLFIPLLPETRCFGLKRVLWRWAGAEIGDTVRISSSVSIVGAGRLVVGSNTWIGPQTMISAMNKVVIGSNCDIAPRVYIGDGTHRLSPEAERMAGEGICLPVHIGSGCWICTNSTILPGVNLGNKNVVAAGSVVANSFEGEQQLIAGTPAKVVKKYTER